MESGVREFGSNFAKSLAFKLRAQLIDIQL